MTLFTKIKNPIWGILFGVLITSCEQDINIVAPYIETPVVFFLLEPTSSENSIRIERIYQGTQSAYQTGMKFDSLYYDKVKVELELINYSGELSKKYDFTPMISNKVEGIFNSDPFFIYKLNDSFPFINQNNNSRLWNPLGIELIKLHLSIPNEDFIVRGFIEPMINPYYIYPDIYLKNLDVYQLDELKIVWGHSDKVRYDQFGMRFIYDELINGKLYEKTAIWITDKGIWTGGLVSSILLYPEKFYRKICTVIKEDHNVSARYLKEIQIEVFCADKYYEYYKLRQEVGWNERLDQELNLENAVGLFSCVGKAHRFGLNLNYKSMDSLASGQYTKQLKFKNW